MTNKVFEIENDFDEPDCSEESRLPPVFILESENDCCAPNYIRGPQGIQGPQGPAGSQSGGIQVITASTTILVGQIYNVCDPTEAITVTLPPISTVLIGGTTTPYTVTNYSIYPITVQGSGSDLVQSSDNAIIPRAPISLTFLPTLFGWLII